MVVSLFWWLQLANLARLTHASHPGVRLRLDPIRADGVGERVAADTHFGCDEPGDFYACGGRDCAFQEPPVLRKIAREGSESGAGNEKNYLYASISYPT
jgi:hypothetical protein